MTVKKWKLCLWIACGLLLLVSYSPLSSQEDLHRVWAIKDAKLVTQAGPPIEKGILIIRNGLIEAVGPNIPIPPDAEVIDGSKLSVYPGLMDGLGQSLLKFPEEKFDMSKTYSGEYTDKDKGITPDLHAFDYVSLGKAIFEKYYKSGFTEAHVLPDRGILTGQSSIFSFSDPDKTKALLLKDLCLGIGFNPAGFGAYPGSLMGVQAFLKQFLSDSAYFDMNRTRWLKEMKGISRPPYSPYYEILTDYVSGKKPVIFLCRNQHDIRRALSLAADYKLNFFIGDLGSESFEVIPELKKAKARIFCTVAFKAPPTSLFSQRGKEEREKAEKETFPKNPAKLAEAGVPFALSSLGTDDPKTFSEGILKAIEAGLPKETALAALTTVPANFFGLERALGTLEPGKIANLVLVEGELLAKETKVKTVFVDGKKFDLKDVKAKEGEKPTVNISGRWEIMIEGGMSMKLTVDFSQEEAALSGKMTTPFGVFDFTGGSVSGNNIYFEMNVAVGGQEIDLYFSAVVTGDTMRGSVVQGTFGSQEFTAKRIPG
jgi:hypothetical protein